MCVDPDWAPFERINAQGQHEGIAADLVQLVARRVGLQIELLPVKDWDESLAASQGKRCQVMSFLIWRFLTASRNCPTGGCSMTGWARP